MITLNNFFIFDYNQVLRMCPEYRKYLVTADEYARLSDPHNGVYLNNPDLINDNASTLAPLSELGRPVAVDLIGPNLARTADLREDELDILNEMHSVNTQSQEQVTNTTVDAVIPVNMNRSVGRVDYYLHPKYVYEDPTNMCDPTILLLPPPKTVLGVGSIICVGEHVVYSISAGEERDPDVVKLIQQKAFCNENKIGIMSSTFRFHRLHNSTTEIKKYLRMTVYNYKTHKLYYIKHVKIDGSKKSHTHKVIRSIGLNKHMVETALRGYDPTLSSRFVNEILDRTIAAVPDMVLPKLLDEGIKPPDSKSKIIKIDPAMMHSIKQHKKKHNLVYYAILQARVGQKLEWLLDDALIDRISEFISMPKYFNQVYGDEAVKEIYRTGGEELYNKLSKKLKSDTFYKIIPALKKDPSVKTVFKHMFGPFFKKFYVKLIMLPPTPNGVRLPFSTVEVILSLIYLDNKGALSKNVYHYLVYLFKLNTVYSRKMMYQIHVSMYDLKSKTDDGITQLNHMLDLYIRMSKNLEDFEDIVHWTTFRDTFDMANDLGIRVRVNKFSCLRDIQEVHDRFSEYLQRDNRALRDYKDRVFIPFSHPEKEYNGFRFVQLTTPEELIEEGKTMHHCVGGYSRRCVEGDSIIFSMRKDERSCITIEIRGTTSRTIEIAQKYTIKDYTVKNQDILKIINDWRNDLQAMHTQDDATYYELCKKENDKIDARKEKERLEELMLNDISEEEKFYIQRKLNELTNQINGLEEELCQNTNDFEVDLIEDNINADVQHAVQGC